MPTLSDFTSLEPLLAKEGADLLLHILQNLAEAQVRSLPCLFISQWLLTASVGERIATGSRSRHFGSKAHKGLGSRPLVIKVGD